MVAQAVAMATMTSYSLSENHGQALLTPYFVLCYGFNTLTWLSIDFSKNPIRCHGGTNRRLDNDVYFVQKPWPNGFTSYSPLCHHFNTVTWLSIELSTSTMGCNGGTIRRNDDNDIIFCPNLIFKQIWPPVPRCATVSTLSYDSTSNFPKTQWVAVVAEVVIIATMTSYFVRNHGQAILTPFTLCVTVSTLSHDSSSNFPHTQWVLMLAQAVVWQQWPTKQRGMAAMAKQQKSWPSNFDPLSHCLNSVTWLSIEFSTNPIRCLDGTSRHYGNNDVIFCPKAISKQLWPLIIFCHRFNTVTWLSIKCSTNPVGCHFGSNRSYDRTDVIFCSKSMSKDFGHFILPCTTVSTLSCDSASNSSQTHWVDMVAQTAAFATMTSYFG